MSSSRPSLRKIIILSATIALVLWVGLTGAWNTRLVQQRMKCAANLEKIGLALSAYLAQHGQSAISLESLPPLGLLESSHLACPAAGQPNYVLVSAPQSGADGTSNARVFEPLANHGKGAHVLFAEGCRFVPKAQFQALNLAEK